MAASAGRAHLVERISLVPLVGGSLFMLVSGVANIARWYPWNFNFPTVHYWVAWITMGALVAHVAAKIGITRAELRPGPPDDSGAEGADQGLGGAEAWTAVAS